MPHVAHLPVSAGRLFLVVIVVLSVVGVRALHFTQYKSIIIMLYNMTVISYSATREPNPTKRFTKIPDSRFRPMIVKPIVGIRCDIHFPSIILICYSDGSSSRLNHICTPYTPHNNIDS